MNPMLGDPSSNPIIPTQKSPLVADDGRSASENNLGNTKIGISITENTDKVPVSPLPRPTRGPGRPPRSTPAPVTWSIRGVSSETRAVLEQGAARAGKTLGQYLNEDVCPFVLRELNGKPAAAIPSLQEEIQYLRQLVENLTTMIVACTSGLDAKLERPEQ